MANSINDIPNRSLKDVSYDELKTAVVKMVKELGISGSGAGYSLYLAVFREKAKVSPDDPITKQNFQDLE
jgi:hypothetical protein